jgi:hypothetical protein
MKKILVALGVFLIAFLPGLVMADTFVLTGNFLQVGVSNSGGLIHDDYIPGDPGLPGIKYDPSGRSNFNVTDFITPGTPLEFYSAGFGGSWITAGYNDGNTFNATTIQTISGSTLSARTTGAFGVMAFTQDLWFDQNSSVIHFLVSWTNTSDSVVTDAVYARGFDPDQDDYIYETNDTLNSIPGSNRVRAVGPYSGWYIDIVDQNGGGVPTVNDSWDQDPYVLLTPRNDGDGDYTLAIAWGATTFDPLETKTLSFDYQVGVVPIPGSVLLMGSGLLGLVGLRKKLKK